MRSAGGVTPLSIAELPTMAFVWRGLKWSPTRNSVVVRVSDTPGAPYQPYNSGARSVVPLLNISKPPRVLTTGTGTVSVWAGSRLASCCTRVWSRFNSPSR